MPDLEILQPPTWPRPKGYSNGISASGRLIFVAGQVGWSAQGHFESDDLVPQIRQALQNTLEVLKEAKAGPENIVRMTWYITDKAAYKAHQTQIGQIYRDLIGHHYPAMAMLVVNALIEDRAKVEIETTAVI